MDRLAAHVIATAALTVTLATVPVLFADASHAATSASFDNSASAGAAGPSSGSAKGSAPSPLTRLDLLPGPLLLAERPAPGQPSPPTAERPSYPAARHLTFHGVSCADAHQVGPTAHTYFDGAISFSVEQYYSADCRAYFSHSSAWPRFRRLHVRFDVSMSVYDATHGAIDGPRTFVGGKGGPGYWSAPVPMAHGTCTQGEVHVFYYPAGAPSGYAEGDQLTAESCD